MSCREGVKMTGRLTARQWRRIFPKLPDSAAKLDVRDLLNTVDLITALFLNKSWLGIASVDTEKPNDIQYRAGRWYVLNDAIICASNDYYISKDSLDREHWIAQLSQKLWLYDPSDLLDAYEAGRKIFRPHDSEKALQLVLNAEIETAIQQRLEFPFNTSRVLRRHVYLPS